MSSSKQIYLLKDFAADVYLSEVPSPPMTSYLPPYTMYTYLHREGGRGGGALIREKVRGGNSSQSWVEILVLRQNVASHNVYVT